MPRIGELSTTRLPAFEPANLPRAGGPINPYKTSAGTTPLRRRRTRRQPLPDHVLLGITPFGPTKPRADRRFLKPKASPSAILRRGQSSQIRSPQLHSNMWMILPEFVFITVRTSFSFSPQTRQRRIEELSISAIFSARYSFTAHSQLRSGTPLADENCSLEKSCRNRNDPGVLCCPKWDRPLEPHHFQIEASDGSSMTNLPQRSRTSRSVRGTARQSKTVSLAGSFPSNPR